MLALTPICPHFRRSAFRSQTLRKMTFVLQNIISIAVLDLPSWGSHASQFRHREFQSEERAVTPGLVCPAAYPSAPPPASRLCHDCPWHSTTQAALRNGASCAPSSIGQWELPGQSFSLCWDCEVQTALTRFQHHTAIGRLQECARVHCPVRSNCINLNFSFRTISRSRMFLKLYFMSYYTLRQILIFDFIVIIHVISWQRSMITLNTTHCTKPCHKLYKHNDMSD